MIAGSALTGCASSPSALDSAPDESANFLAGTYSAPVAESAPPPAPIIDSAYAPPRDFQPRVPTQPLPAIAASTSANSVIPRSAWTNAGPVKPVRPLGGVSLTTFHHDGDPGGFTDTTFAVIARDLERIRAYHAKTGFEDIAYHYAIDRAGRLWALRSIAYRGEHVRPGYDANHVLHKWNDHNVGVVVLGNFMLQDPSEAQKQRIISWGAELRAKYRLSIAQIKVHQELVSTECPGVRLRPYMDLVRQKRLI